MKSFLLLLLVISAIFLTSCSKQRKDFETAKNAVGQELVSRDTARFCSMSDATFSTKNGDRSVKLWVDTDNRIGAHVRTHFEVLIDARTGAVKGATCLECAAEDEKQKLPEAMAELQAPSPSK
jgi:hypothetical protein